MNIGFMARAIRRLAIHILVCVHCLLQSNFAWSTTLNEWCFRVIHTRITALTRLRLPMHTVSLSSWHPRAREWLSLVTKTRRRSFFFPTLTLKTSDEELVEFSIILYFWLVLFTIFRHSLFPTHLSAVHLMMWCRSGRAFQLLQKYCALPETRPNLSV